MRKRLFHATLLVAATLSCFCIHAGAQTFKTGFFLDNYAYSYRLNPGDIPEMYKQVIGIGIGDITVAPSSNVPYTSFLFNKGGETVSFLDGAVKGSDFLDGLPDISDISLDLTENILSLATVKGKGMVTFDLGLRSITSAGIPKGFFEVIKDPTSKMHHEFSNLTLDTRNHLEAAIGIAMKFGPVTVGLRGKALIGVAAMNMALNNITASVDQISQSAVLSGSGSILLSQKIASFGTDSNGNLNFRSVAFGKQVGIGGLGFGVDLGATYRTPLPGLELSVSALDLGSMKWNNNFAGKLDINGKSLTKDDVGNPTTIIGEMLDFKEDKSAETPQSASLTPTFLVGARYYLPFYDRLSVGILGTIRKGLNEIRAGVSICPVNFIDIAGSAAFSSAGTDYGAAVSFKLPGFNLFVGMDSITLKALPKCTTVNAGLTIAF